MPDLPLGSLLLLRAMPGCLAVLLALLAALVAAVSRPISPYELPREGDVYAALAGTWDWAGRPGTCSDNPHTIGFSPDRRTMILTFVRAPEGGEREVRYEVRGVTRSGVRGFITGETRLTDDGEPVVWDLVLTSPDSYRWHRTDWAEGGYTGEVVRCGGSAGAWLPLVADDTVAVALDTATIRPQLDSTTRVRLRYEFAAPRAVPVLRGVPIPAGVRYQRVESGEYAVCRAGRTTSFALMATLFDSTGREVGRSMANTKDSRGFPSISGAAGPPLCRFLAQRATTGSRPVR